MARIDAAIAERARQQLGLITVHQLDELGCTRRMRQGRSASGVLVAVGHRVYRHAAVPVTWEQTVLGAQLDAGDDAVVSHMSAACLWQFAEVGQGAVEPSVPARRRPRPVRGRIHRMADLEPADVQQRGLFRLTSPERTLLDVASRLGRRQLESVLDGAARDRLLTVESVGATRLRLGRRGRPGLQLLDQILAGAGPRTDSWLERRLLSVIAEAGLPVPRTQVCLQRHDGGLARVDLLYDDVRLVIEVDGHRTHSTRRQRQADAEREAALVARGWRVIRFTYEDVTERPDYVVHTIRLHRSQQARA